MQQHAPQHIAIIMDGNRRWAGGGRERFSVPASRTNFGGGQRGGGIPDGTAHFNSGHRRGAETAEAITAAAFEAGTGWLTLFAFSTENWKRSPAELNALMGVFRYFLANKVDALIEKNLRLRVLGDTGGFAPDIARAIEAAVERSAGNDGGNLSIALGYGGQSDMANAMRRIGKKIAQGDLTPDDIDDATIKAHLATAELPPVDLLIRTGREKRISNFMLWDIAYAELAFTNTLWPDFEAAELHDIIAEYRRRVRRFGGDDAPRGDGDSMGDTIIGDTANDSALTIPPHTWRKQSSGGG